MSAHIFWNTSKKIDRINDELGMVQEENEKRPDTYEARSHLAWAIFQLRLASDEFFKLSRRYRREKRSKQTGEKVPPSDK